MILPSPATIDAPYVNAATREGRLPGPAEPFVFVRTAHVSKRLVRVRVRRSLPDGRGSAGRPPTRAARGSRRPRAGTESLSRVEGVKGPKGRRSTKHDARSRGRVLVHWFLVLRWQSESQPQRRKENARERNTPSSVERSWLPLVARLSPLTFHLSPLNPQEPLIPRTPLSEE